MGAALDLSRCILNDLNVMQANAWIYWQVQSTSIFICMKLAS